MHAASPGYRQATAIAASPGYRQATAIASPARHIGYKAASPHVVRAAVPAYSYGPPATHVVKPVAKVVNVATVHMPVRVSTSAARGACRLRTG